jgi:hypothetical protein
LARFGRLDLAAQYQVDLAQADALIQRDRWSMVQAVVGATSADDLTERLRALISE